MSDKKLFIIRCIFTASEQTECSTKNKLLIGGFFYERIMVGP